MKKKIMMMLVAALTIAASYAGIYRHDKSKSEYTDLAKQPQFDCVTQLFWKDTWHGSCVLIGDRYVLSAAHCFMEPLTQQDTIYNNKTRVIVNQPYAEYARDITQYFVYFNGKRYQSKTVHIYPRYLIAASSHKCDIALIELTEPVTGVKPAKICTTFDELHSEIVGVGYGGHGIASQPESISSEPEKLAGENVIDSMGGYVLNGKPVSMICDFDHATKKQCSSMGSSTPQPLEYVVSGGDSGGGAFRKTSSGWELIGICGGNTFGGVNVNFLTTPGIGYYGQTMEWQRVSVFADWIKAKEKETLR